MLHVLLDLLFGAAMGVLGGFFGIGGGLIAIPLMILLLDMSQAAAQGTALVMMVPNLTLALWRYQQRCAMPWRQASCLGVFGLLGALLTSQVALQLHSNAVQMGFGVFMLVLAGVNLRRRCASVSHAPARAVTGLGMGALGSACGALGGFFGVGASLVAVPVLTGRYRVPQWVAQGMALMLALPSCSATLVTYAWHQQVDWSTGIALALGALSSVSLGVRFAWRMPERMLSLCFTVFLLICAVLIMLKA